MEDILPEDILRRINDLVPHDVPPCLDDWTEAKTIATETGVTILQRRRQERAMQLAYEAMRALYGAQTVIATDAHEMTRAALYGGKKDIVADLVVELTDEQLLAGCVSLYPAAYVNGD